MIQFPEIKQALRAQNFDDLSELVAEYVRQEDDGFDQVLRQMMYLAATEQYNDRPVGVVYLDAVRDLSTLYEQEIEDAMPLLNVALQFFCTLNLREFDKSVVSMKPEHFSEPVFVGDLVNIIRKGDRNQALEESAKLLRMMDNQFYLVEILAEIASGTVTEDGWPVILSGAVLKSVDYVERSQFRPLVYLLVDYLTRQSKNQRIVSGQDVPLPPVHFDTLYSAALSADNRYRDDLLFLTYTQQLWEGARMKEHEIQKHLASWLDEQYGGYSEQDAAEYSPRSAEVSDIIRVLRDDEHERAIAFTLGYLQDDGGVGTLFQALTDVFLESHSFENAEQLLYWNALRTTIAYTTPPQQYQAFVRAVKVLL